MEDDKLSLRSPWMVFAEEVGVLFGRDPEVTVGFDNDEPRLTLRVDNPTKAEGSRG